MNYDNVKLWFAHKDGNIVTIDEINEENKNDNYSCPVCGSELKPKAIKSKQVSSHFAHTDSSKCNSETMIHWWFKNKFLEVGDTFTVASDKERHYIAKEVKVEQSYQVSDGEYKPDVTIHTECGNVIYFEMAFSNKKKVKDYLDIWLELKNIVVEIDIKQLMLKKEIPAFKALFYEGKCFNTKKNDTYYNTIGKYKEEKLKGDVDSKLKERIRKLDWFWNDVLRYKKGEVDAEYLLELVKNVQIDEKFVVYEIVKRIKCNEIKEVREYLKEEIKKYKTTHHFYYSMDNDNPIREAVSKLNTFFKDIDNNYKVSLQSNSVKRKAYRYTRFRKIGYWKVEYYYYTVDLRHKVNRHKDIRSIDVTTYIKEICNVDTIFDYFYEKLKEHSISVECLECREDFNLTSKELEFYRSKNFKLPKRCKSCRNKRKQKGEII